MKYLVMRSLILCQFFIVSGTENIGLKFTSPLVRSFLSSCPTVSTRLPLNPYRTWTNLSHSAWEYYSNPEQAKQNAKLGVIYSQRSTLKHFMAVLPPMDNDVRTLLRHLFLIPVIFAHATAYEYVDKPGLNSASLFMLGMIAKTGLDIWRLDKEDDQKLDNWRFSKKALDKARMFWNQEREILTHSYTTDSLNVFADNTSAILKNGLRNQTIANVDTLADRAR